MEPLIILLSFLVASFICLVIKNRGIVEFISIVASFIALVESFIVAVKVASFGTYSTLGYFSVDSLGAIVMLIIGFVGFFTGIYSIKYLRRETEKGVIGFTRVKQYFILLNLFLGAMFLAITTSSPVFAWICVEATTLSTAFLISFYNKPSAMEAAWKYLIINSVGLLLAFLGTLLYFTSVVSMGQNGLVTWQTLMAGATHFDPLIAKIAFIFVLIGYGTKAGLVPMHTWLPDAHSKAPAPISALLSGVLLNVALATVLKFKIITDVAIGSAFSGNLLIIFGLLSIIVAAFIIFTQKNYKRLMAYSSIENIGIMAVGFGFGGIGIFAATLHMIYNALTKSALFLSAGTVFLKYSSTKIAKVKGALTALPVTSVILLVGFLSITGIPPFGIFLTKVFILSSGMNIHPILTVVALLGMAIVFIGFLRHIVSMVFGEVPADIKIGEESTWLIVPPFILMAVVLCLSFYIPHFLQVLINDVVLHY